MRVKINSEIQKYEVEHESNIYARFAPYFDIMFDEDSQNFSVSNFDEWYVPNNDIEKKLLNIKASPRNGVHMLVGSVGIGKTTLIQKTLCRAHKPTLDDNVLIIPFYLNGTSISENTDREMVAARLQAASDLVQDHYKVDVREPQLANFVASHRPDVLNTNQRLDRRATPKEKISDLRTSDPYSYYAEELKFVASSSYLKKVLIILDDIEACEPNEQIEALRKLLRLKKCLTNFGPQSRSFTVDFIFSVRPMTHKTLLQTDQLSQWRPRTPIQLIAPCDISEVFKKRFDAIVKAVGAGKKNVNQSLTDVDSLEAWEASRLATMRVCDNFAERHGNELSALCNHNLPRTFEQMLDILTSSRWYEADAKQEIDRVGGGFRINDELYKNTEAGFLRALALKNQNLFDRDVNSPITNLFRNSINDSTDLMLIYIVALIVQRLKRFETYNHYFYKKNFEESLSIIYSKEDIDDNLEIILNYAIRKSLMREEKFSDGSIRYLPMPSLFAHWRMLRRSCIYLEFCRDDTFIMRTSLVTEQIRSGHSTSNLYGETLFQALITFVGEIAEKEKRLHRYADQQNLVDRKQKIFGERPISGLLAKGIYKSLNRYYRTKQDGNEIPEILIEKMKEIAEKVQRFID